MSLIDILPKVEVSYEWGAPDYYQTLKEKSVPVLLKGLVKSWPIVSAGGYSDESLLEYLCGKVAPGMVSTLEAPFSTRGYFFYSDTLQGFNFERKQAKFHDFCERLLSYKYKSSAFLSIQSAFVDEYFPGVDVENRMTIMGDNLRPRIWIGNKTIVGTHYDDADNIACVVAGKRRFTLFPPDQIKNLYVGPLEFTPAGATISMASLTQPDFTKYPRLKQALEYAVVADMEPGDGLYIPTLWWHHVEALAEINVLINYWCGGAIGGDQESPYPHAAMLMSLLAMNKRSPSARRAWKALFDYYVFREDGEIAEYLPQDKRGIMAEIDEVAAERLKKWLISQLQQ
ncbi:cupin-like domain-containing protein [Cellvibrio sp. PSBB023]|uniref:cupin-like domain-containing protein n=1 Tax=Cellvibrio sp. PSBB023 TaxID=1945512 RepID=UPI00098EC8AC|nr:cupin-like domain-containing protein [Cellvibrio sp. PSBB023]AQT60295.1 hypothetical protein B0D95_09450 [Cellvibrio sp. PSBB023]